MARSVRDIVRKMNQHIKDHPEILISEYEKMYEGITEKEAEDLADVFINMMNGDAGGYQSYAEKLEWYKNKYGYNEPGDDALTEISKELDEVLKDI